MKIFVVRQTNEYDIWKEEDFWRKFVVTSNPMLVHKLKILG